MRLGVLAEPMGRIIPKIQYGLVQRVRSGREGGKMPLVLRLYTRAGDDNILKMFEAMPDNITLATLQNCMDGALRLYEVVDRFEPDSNAKVSVWHGAKEPNMRKALEKLRRAFSRARARGPGAPSSQLAGVRCAAHACAVVTSMAACARMRGKELLLLI